MCDSRLAICLHPVKVRALLAFARGRCTVELLLAFERLALEILANQRGNVPQLDFVKAKLPALDQTHAFLAKGEHKKAALRMKLGKKRPNEECAPDNGLIREG